MFRIAALLLLVISFKPMTGQENGNQELKLKLERLLVKDQTLRKLYGPASETFERGSKEFSYYLDMMNRQDSANLYDLRKLVEEHGWPAKSRVGEEANQAAFLIIQHADTETQEKYLPLLRRSVSNGESEGRHLAMLEDRILMRNGKQQIYGTQVVKQGADTNWQLYDLKDPEGVNARRAEVGLGPLEEYLSRWDIQWSAE